MKKFGILVIFTLLTVSLFAQNISDFDIQGNDDGTMTILNYKGDTKSIVIPEKIFNMPVTRLVEGSFKNKGLTSVVIPGTLKFIGNNTFQRNQLTSVTIPETVVYIGNNAFDDNRLTSVALPKKLEYIGNAASANNQLASVTIPGNVITIDNAAFFHNRLTSVRIPDSVTFIGDNAFNINSIINVVIGNGVAFIGSYAFSANNSSDNYDIFNQITSVTLGTSLRYIGSYAFYGHRATTIVIPESIVYIGMDAFRQDNEQNTLKNITIGKQVMFGQDNNSWGAFHDNGNFDLFYVSNQMEAGKYTFSNGTWAFNP